MDIGFTGAKFTIKRITTNLLIFPDKPQLTIKNPFDKDVHIHAFALLPDNNFKLIGLVKVQINGRIFFEPTTAGDFTDIEDFNMPIPELHPVVFEANKNLEVFIATSTQTPPTVAALTVGILISEI